MSASVQPDSTATTLESLPFELLVAITSWLDLVELSRVRLVSRALCAAAGDFVHYRSIAFRYTDSKSYFSAAAARRWFSDCLGASHALAGVQTLSVAFLSRHGKRRQVDVVTPDALARLVEQAPCLTALDIRGLARPVTEAHLALLPPRLCALNLDHNFSANSNEVSLAPMSALSNLEVLSLRDGPVCPPPVAALDCLRRLSLAGAGCLDDLDALVGAIAGSPCAATVEALGLMANPVLAVGIHGRYDGWCRHLPDLPVLSELSCDLIWAGGHVDDIVAAVGEGCDLAVLELRCQPELLVALLRAPRLRQSLRALSFHPPLGYGATLVDSEVAAVVENVPPGLVHLAVRTELADKSLGLTRILASCPALETLCSPRFLASAINALIDAVSSTGRPMVLSAGPSSDPAIPARLLPAVTEAGIEVSDVDVCVCWSTPGGLETAGDH